MAMTLAEMKVGMSDKVSQQIVDIFLRESEILQLLPFDNCVSPQGGSTLTYSYIQKKLPSVAAFRALNVEYTANQATVEKKTADLKIFGGKFQIDRVLKQAEGPWNNMSDQIREKVLAAISLFHYTLVNGDATTHTTEFDGLDKMLAGTSTEYNTGTGSAIDVSTMTNLKTNAEIQTMARLLGYKTESEEAFGRKVTSMDGVRFMDLGKYYTVSDTTVTGNDCVKAGISRNIGASNAAVTGLTDIYAVKFDVNDGFHAASLTGNSAIRQYLPDFNTPGAVKDGEVEMVAATVLKNTAHAGVLRNIKIA